MERLKEVIETRDVEIGIITAPPQEAQKVADLLVGANIKGILNFSPAPVRAMDPVKVRNVFFTSALDNLVYYLTN
jgi:redox-sensing transcriptional repressor